MGGVEVRTDEGDAVCGARLERLFEGLTVQGFALWFNVVHTGLEEASPALSVGGVFRTASGDEQILLERRGDTWFDLVNGASSGGGLSDVWEQALPWMVADGVWREVRQRIVVSRSAPRNAGQASSEVRL
jgi:hypothetical protein